MVELVDIVGGGQARARDEQLDIAQPLGGVAVGDALEARHEEIPCRAQRLDLDHAAVGGLERAVIDDRGRIGRERPQLDLAAHTVRGAQPGDANALTALRARRHSPDQLAAGAAGLGAAAAALAASSAFALRSLRGTARSGLLRGARLATPAASRKRMMRSDGCAPFAIQALTLSRSSLRRSL